MATYNTQEMGEARTYYVACPAVLRTIEYCVPGPSLVVGKEIE